MAKGKIKPTVEKDYLTRFDVPVTDGWMIEAKILKPLVRFRYTGRVGDVKSFPADVAEIMIKGGYIVKV